MLAPSFRLHVVSILSLVALSICAFQTMASADDNKKDKKGKKDETPAVASYTGPKKRLAVAYSAPPVNQGNRDSVFYNSEYLRTLKQMNGNINTIDDVGLKLTEMLTTALVNTNRFVVLERQNLGDIRDEIEVGNELGNEQTRVKKGNVLGAQLIIRCAVTEFAPNKSSKGGIGRLGGALGLGGGEKVSSVTVDVKMFDPNTSVLLASKSASGDSKTKAAAGDVHVGSLVKITHPPKMYNSRVMCSFFYHFVVRERDQIRLDGIFELE